MTPTPEMRWRRLIDGDPEQLAVGIALWPDRGPMYPYVLEYKEPATFNPNGSLASPERWIGIRVVHSGKDDVPPDQSNA